MCSLGQQQEPDQEIRNGGECRERQDHVELQLRVSWVSWHHLWLWVLVLQSPLHTGEHQLLLSRGRALLSITPSFPQTPVCCPPACCRPLSPPLSLPSILVDHEQQLTPATSSSQDAAGRQKDAEPPAQPPPSLAFVTSASLPCGPCLLLASRSPGAAHPSALAVRPFCSFRVIYLFLFLLVPRTACREGLGDVARQGWLQPAVTSPSLTPQSHPWGSSGFVRGAGLACAVKSVL